MLTKEESKELLELIIRSDLKKIRWENGEEMFFVGYENVEYLIRKFTEKPKYKIEKLNESTEWHHLSEREIVSTINNIIDVVNKLTDIKDT